MGNAIFLIQHPVLNIVSQVLLWVGIVWYFGLFSWGLYLLIKGSKDKSKAKKYNRLLTLAGRILVISTIIAVVVFIVVAICFKLS